MIFIEINNIQNSEVWQEYINDEKIPCGLEEHLFKKFPEIKLIKDYNYYKFVAGFETIEESIIFKLKWS